MKTILSAAFAFMFCLNIGAQTSTSTGSLLPDQNPNYQKSRDRYVEQSSTLTQNEGLTTQNTYKAIDDVQAKKERKELASQRRQDRRMARIQSRGNRRYYYGNGGYNNGYYNNGYYNNGYYNNGFNNGYYAPSVYPRNPIYGSVAPALNTALLGIAIWSLLRH